MSQDIIYIHLFIIQIVGIWSLEGRIFHLSIGTSITFQNWSIMNIPSICVNMWWMLSACGHKSWQCFSVWCNAFLHTPSSVITHAHAISYILVLIVPYTVYAVPFYPHIRIMIIICHIKLSSFYLWLAAVCIGVWRPAAMKTDGVMVVPSCGLPSARDAGTKQSHRGILRSNLFRKYRIQRSLMTNYLAQPRVWDASESSTLLCPFVSRIFVFPLILDIT